MKKQVPKEGILFQGRNRGAPIPCTVLFEKNGAKVKFELPVRRFAPGQSACFYHGETLLFGGEIEGAEAVNKSFPDFFEKLQSVGIEVKKH